MPLIFELSGDRLSLGGDCGPESRRLKDEDFKKLQDFARRYRSLRAVKEEQAFEPLGRELFLWLNGTQKRLEGQARPAAGPFRAEFRVADAQDVKARAFLNAPWEVLCDGKGFLAGDALQPFCVVRRIGKPSAKASMSPDHSDITALFMAAAPEGQAELDYEAEEVALLEATNDLSLNLAVEESGALSPFAARVKLEGELDIVHLSCHGTVGETGGILLFEDEVGHADAVEASRLRQVAFGEHLPRLIFLSACHSADEPGKPKDANDPAPPLSTGLVQAGFPAVLGWGGSVLDTDATRFAKEFYGQLARGARPDLGAAYARRMVLAKDGCPGRDWHLARLYLGPDGGGAICAPGAPRRGSVIADRGHQEILQTRLASEAGEAGHRLSVASRQGSPAPS